MARQTPKKKTVVKSATSLLNFFQKSDGSARPRSGDIDVKPDFAGVDDQLQQGRKVRPEKKGSACDPVVISDDEEVVSTQNGAKRRRLSSKSTIANHAIPPRSTSLVPAHVKLADDKVTLESPCEVLASPIAGFSRLPYTASPPRSPCPRVSPSPSVTVPLRSPRQSCSPPPPQLSHPFPGNPDFVPPSTWPNLINIAREPDAISDDSQTQDPGDDQDDPVNDDSCLDLDSEEPVEAVPITVSDVIPGEAQDLAMEWDEGDDEGMGMEEPDEGGDDEASAIVQTPPPKVWTKGKGKVTECPMCGKSLKGKVNTVVQKHINTCLDSTPTSRPKVSRPITSINHSFSPGPSSPSPPPETDSKGPNAFSVLMSGHKEDKQWRDAEIDLKRDGKRVFGRRNAPFYKVLSGMPIAVDAFRYGAIPKVTAYLLTHAHSDHYTNLSKSWTHGPIYCSQTTANLIIHMLGVEPPWVHGLPDNIPFVMPNTGGVTVTPLEANHCPGSSIFLFEGPQTVNAGDTQGFKSPYVGSRRIFRYLHCGDFRACPRHVLHPAVARAKIDTCYLDTTYLNSKYCFPPQPQVIDACASLARKSALGLSADAPPIPDAKQDVKPDLSTDVKPDRSALEEIAEVRSKEMMKGWLVKREEDVKEELVELKDVKPKGRTLVVMGTYSIGKERIVKAVARALGSKIYCDPRKKGILLCETDPELHSMLSSDPIESQVHLLPLGNIQLDRLQDYLHRLTPHFDRVLGFRPTGWTYTPPAGTDLLPDVNMVIRRDQARTFTDVSLKPMRGSNSRFMMYGVPYSEHSSFFELTCFALSMPGQGLKMIATVNVGNEKSRAKMKKWFEKWAAEKAKRKEKGLPAIVEYRDETYETWDKELELTTVVVVTFP